MSGKPHVMTAEIIDSLKLSFSRGLTDNEASLFCGISPRTLYDYCSKNPDFAELKEQLKRSPSIKAKLNLVELINKGDINTSKFWLEKRNKAEFGNRVELVGNELISFENSVKIFLPDNGRDNYLSNNCNISYEYKHGSQLPI